MTEPVIKRTHILARALIMRDGPEGPAMLFGYQIGAASTSAPL